MFYFFILGLQLLSVLRLSADASISKPDCTHHCGDVQIPYPFGIGSNCYHDPSYEIICNSSFTPSKPFLQQFNLEVLDIVWPGRYSEQGSYESYDQIVQVALPPPNLCGNDGGPKGFHSPDLKGSPFRFSESNVLMIEGCGTSAVLKNRGGEVVAGCASICDSDNANSMNGTTCYGVGCCQATIDRYSLKLDFYEIVVDFEQSMKSNSCNTSVAVITDPAMEISGSPSSRSTSLEWWATWVSSIPYDKVVNVSCTTETHYPEFNYTRCSCAYIYEGNPYLPYGCQVVEKCRKCEARCDFRYNSTGSGFYYYCKRHSMLRRPSFLGFSIGMGAVLLVLGFYWLYRYLKRRREIKLKAKHFKRNGGLLLQQQMSSDEGVVEATKVFTVIELEKATDNFNENRILGQGGQGTVYKGMLLDGKIVAIKKAKKVDESQVEQFINEVVILSQINHRNVVRVLGCCLETEVPILVYEFIPNGTVYEHLQGQIEDFHLTWKMRLQIAAESAGAVAYLHSSSSAPIYHRDNKSTNILLDEKYRAKVSDFGTSKAITIDQTHVTTIVLGTYGYLDPEYFQSNQFTEKSDVYSFGVVLVELITGKKPICLTGNGGWVNLASEFITQMEEPQLLAEMIDARIIDEGKEDEFMAVAELAIKCLNINGKQRPTMKQIAVQLDQIRSSGMPVPKEPSLAQNCQVVTEVIDSDEDPFISKGVFFTDIDPPVCSIEIEPLRKHGSF